MAGAMFGLSGKKGAKVVVCRCVEVHQSLLPELHHGDCGEDLGDGSDTKDGVLGDWRLPRNISESGPWNHARAVRITATARPDGQRSDLGHRRLQVEVIDPTVRGNGVCSLPEVWWWSRSSSVALLPHRRRWLPTASG